MGRPPNEWPIPVYVVELRERLLLTYRVRPGALSRALPSALAPIVSEGSATVALALGAGRCLKTVGGPATLAHEFHVAELITPVSWSPACREPVHGNCVLRAFTDSRSLARFLRVTLSLESSAAELSLKTTRGETSCRIGSVGWSAHLVETGDQAPDEEDRLLHPECYFFPDRRGELIRSVTVHQYSRSTTPLPLASTTRDLIAALLGCPPHELDEGAAGLQKRCTHTWSFPPERILLPPGARQSAPGSRWALVA
jgi:hypothetical protein